MQSGNNPVKRAGFDNFLNNHADHYTHFWEIRVAVNPAALVLSDDKNHVIRIKQIVKDVFGNTGCIAKVMTFGSEDSIFTEGYDGTTSHAGMDRDQRGKEICITVPNTEFNNLTTEKYKELMLRLWGKLEAANIPLEFMCVPGDKKIEGPGGNPTPFSISSKYPDRNEWDDVHGILYKEYHPCGIHPIDNVYFTDKDLINAGISFNTNKILKSHNNYYADNVTESKRRLQLEIESILSQKDCYSDAIEGNACESIMALCQSYATFETEKQTGERQIAFEKLCKENKEIQFLLQALPRSNDKNFAQDGDAINKLSKVYRYKPREIEDVFVKIRLKFNEVKAEIKADFARHQLGDDVTAKTMRIDWSDYINDYNEAMLDSMIDNNPAAVQILFRHIVSLERRQREHQKFIGMVVASSKLPEPQSTNYIFSYGTKSAEIKGHNPAYHSVNNIKILPVSKLNQDSNVLSGWVKFHNEREVSDPRKLGKWVLRFKNGDRKIDEAWQTLVDLVAQNKLFEVKVSVQNERFDHQSICVYVSDGADTEDVCRVYELLQQHGLLDLHECRFENNHDIDFILDESTRLYGSKPSFTGTSISRLLTLNKSKDKIDEAAFKFRFAYLAEPIKAKISALFKTEVLDGVDKFVNNNIVYSNDDNLETQKIASLKKNFGNEPVYQHLKDFSDQVALLQDCKHVKDEVKFEFKYLLRVIEDELINHAPCKFMDTPQSVALEHFAQIARDMVNNKDNVNDLDALQANLKKLDIKLALKPPMSKNLKMAICGVIGAIVGAVIGFAIGAAITIWAGGFASLPAAIAGSVLGFSIGTAVGVALGGSAGATIGFFHDKRKQAKLQEYNEESTALLNKVRLAG